ncbi:MAG: acyl-CoA thioesterase [Robiginitomaculum sp.]|nr:MAG: acyl-CoA thioesterase [Robiginitomaculum sp.]
MVRLIDLVFPDQTNHQGNMFGGAALAMMDKVAFLTAARFARRGFVTAAVERTDFKAPVLVGELVDITGTIRSVGRSSLAVRVDLTAENLLDGTRRLTTHGEFTMVATDRKTNKKPLPPVPDYQQEPANLTRNVELVFPGDTDHRGFLFGGHALQLMEKAAFVAASRHARCSVVMAALKEINFTTNIHIGEMIEITAKVKRVGRTSMRIAVQLFAEDLTTGQRRKATVGEFVMVALDDDGRPTPAPPFDIGSET